MTRSWCPLLIVGLATFCGANATNRTTVFVPLDEGASWRDMAYLAATTVNNSTGSLVALDTKGTLSPECSDYLKRYGPSSIYLVDSSSKLQSYKASLPLSGLKSIEATSAEQAALNISKVFWKSSKTVVICENDDYDSALIGSSVAGLVKAPLLFVDRSKAKTSVNTELKRLGATKVIWIGNEAQKFSVPSTNLRGPLETMAWVQKQGIKVSYVAAVNPLDRTHFITRKLSLVGAQLAIGRSGIVAPLKFQSEWKRAFPTTKFAGQIPSGLPASPAPVKSGTIDVGNHRYPFFLTGSPNEQNLRLSIDTSGSGRFTSPLASGDLFEIDGKKWAVSLGTRTKFGDTDVHLTWPVANDVQAELSKYYRALGSSPEHLCLVGFPDTLPHAIIGQGGIVEEQASDLPYALGSESDFARIGVGRVIAENIHYGTIYASRALTYPDLQQPSWQSKSGQAEWENTLGPLFENVGYSDPYHLTSSEVPWLVPPSQGKPGTRSPSFAQNSPLANCAVLTHSEHSWWRGLGTMFSSDAEVLLAPTVVESGGCATTCLDRERDNRSVVARLLRLGAISFSGGSRELPAQAQPLRMEFWNGVLAGNTLGQAHRRALNSALVIIKDQNEGPGGPYRYCANVRMLFGDPALSIKTPSAPRSKPAKTIVAGNLVSVFAPEKWSIVKAIVPPDWKQWANKDLYVVRGPGAFSMSSWSGEGRDKEIPLVAARFNTPKKIKSISQMQNANQLGWNGKWHSMKNKDGSFTNMFVVRMVDFDQAIGKVLNKADRIDYQLEFE